MKTVIAGMGILAVIGGIIFFRELFAPQEYLAPEKEIVTETKEVSQLENRIKSAQNAKMSELEATAQAAYQDTMTKGLKEIELEVIRTYNAELKVREAQLEEEVSF